MIRSRSPVVFLAVFLAAIDVLDAGPPQPARTAREMVPIQWLEAAADSPKRDLPVYRSLQASDPRIDQANRMVDNEAARFIRTLIAAAWRETPAYANHQPLPALPIVFQPGGNNARSGFYLAEGDQTREFLDTPYVLLDFDANRLSHTLLHEGGHVVDRIVRAGARDEATWSGVPHSTFAITDRTTAISEGFATHLETIWGHYGADDARRAYYHRLTTDWTPDSAIRGEFFTPIRDIMTFSQNWARYSAVRDGLPVFEGHVYPGDYLRSQYDPARDRARLKTPNAMVASEGVVASVFFWIVEGHARTAGVSAQGGLDQSGLLEAEMHLVGGLRNARKPDGDRPFDLCDIVAAQGATGSPERRQAIERFVALTRAATIAPGARRKWSQVYAGAIALDLQASRKLATELDSVRAAAVADATADPARLRALVGPVLPVRVERASLRLVALGPAFPAEFDLNAAGQPELLLLSDDASVRSRIEQQLDEKPFQSYADFETRTGTRLAALGAAVVKAP
jgi:hypothetical protein